MTGQVQDCPTKSFQVNAAIGQHIRCVLSSGKLSAAGASDTDIGTLLEEAFAADDWRTLQLYNKMGTQKFVASAAVTQYANVYGAAAGKISSTPNDNYIGIAMEAASGDGSVIEVLRLSGQSQRGVVIEEVTFTEAGDTTYTGNVTVPAGAYLLDVEVHGVALWDDGTSASLKVGDGSDDDGFYTAVDLKATDLLAGESICFARSGGVEGTYIDQTANHREGLYNASARTITGVVTTGGQDGTAGRTRMLVKYSVPATTTAATGA